MKGGVRVRERERREPKMRRTRKASEGGEAGIEGAETTRGRFYFSDVVHKVWRSKMAAS